MNSSTDHLTTGASGTWFDVLALMQRALAMLDATGGAAEVGAHLDLAANRLQEHMLQSGLPAAEEPPIIETL
jgi:hypothetical protein